MVVPCQSGKVLSVMGRMWRARDPGSRWMSFSDEEVDRYARHLVLREIGGPGAPAALYLAAAGVGRIGLADPDTVALSNLQRQILYASADIGRAKVEVAAERLTGLNPHVAIEPIAARLGPDNAAALV